MTRRDFLAGISAAAALAQTVSTQTPTAVGKGSPSSTGGATLREVAAQRGILAGCAVSLQPLKNDADYADLVRTQAGIVVAENEMKFAPLRPSPTEFHFADADFFVEFAEQNGIRVRGHNFVWHKQLPTWFDTYVTPKNAEDVLVNHITQVSSRYRNRIHSWDVVNEAVYLEDGRVDGLRESAWLKLLGPGYIETAFRAARRADPHAMLVYNDYGIEADTQSDGAKRKALLTLLRSLKERSVPVDALGVQSHLSAAPDFGYGSGLTEMLAEVRKMGMKVLITELDVNDRRLTADLVNRDKQVAELYGSYLQKALAEPATCAVLTWGITDRYTWLNGTETRSDGLHQRCLPFDDQLKPKPAFAAEMKAFSTATKRIQV